GLLLGHSHSQHYDSLALCWHVSTEVLKILRRLPEAVQRMEFPAIEEGVTTSFQPRLGGAIGKELHASSQGRGCEFNERWNEVCTVQVVFCVEPERSARECHPDPIPEDDIQSVKRFIGDGVAARQVVSVLIE